MSFEPRDETPAPTNQACGIPPFEDTDVCRCGWFLPLEEAREEEAVRRILSRVPGVCGPAFKMPRSCKKGTSPKSRLLSVTFNETAKK